MAQGAVIRTAPAGTTQMDCARSAHQIIWTGSAAGVRPGAKDFSATGSNASTSGPLRCIDCKLRCRPDIRCVEKLVMMQHHLENLRFKLSLRPQQIITDPWVRPHDHHLVAARRARPIEDGQRNPRSPDVVHASAGGRCLNDRCSRGRWPHLFVPRARRPSVSRP